MSVFFFFFSVGDYLGAFAHQCNNQHCNYYNSIRFVFNADRRFNFNYCVWFLINCRLITFDGWPRSSVPSRPNGRLARANSRKSASEPISSEFPGTEDERSGRWSSFTAKTRTFRRRIIITPGNRCADASSPRDGSRGKFVLSPT